LTTKLIKLSDENETLVEIEVPQGQVEAVSGGFADKVEGSFDKVRSVLLSVCRPITETWKELNREMQVDQVEVQLGLSFEGEGNLFVTKSKAGANLTVTLTIKPKG